MSTALLTDMYELTMLDAWIKDGRQDDPAVFEVFGRRLQPGFRYGVVAGIERVVDAIENFNLSRELDKSSHPTYEFIKALGLSDETMQFLRDYKFTGTLLTYKEGDLYFPGSPIVQVHGRLADVMLETVILSILNHDCAVASKAARIVSEARGAVTIEMGSRRTHEVAAVAAARAAYLAGFTATSNLEAGRRYGIPVKGTAAHAFTLSYMPSGGTDGDGNTLARRQDAELAAFKAQVAAMGVGTTLLVDTFNIEQGIRNAVEAAGTRLGAVRIDSGDLAFEAERARHLLDKLGAFGTRIIASSDLDENVIKDLRVAGAPIDGYGVGTQLVSVQPAGLVYKLVEVNGVGVAKASRDKLSVGGAKRAYRTYDEHGKISGEKLAVPGDEGYTDELDTPFGTPPHGRNLQHVMMAKGKRTEVATLEDAREFHHKAVDTLPANERRVWFGDHGPYITAEVAK